MKVTELMTSADAAAFLEISESQVNRLAVAGTLHTYMRTNGKRGVRIFHRDEVTRLSVERQFA